MIAAATRLVTNDPDRYVRKSAVEALVPAVRRRRAALETVVAARASDPDPLVRKVAGWYCPGGPIYRRLLQWVEGPAGVQSEERAVRVRASGA